MTSPPLPLSLEQVLSAPNALGVLGLPLSSSLTDAEVRSAYRAAALAWHPDKISATAEATQALIDAHGQAFIRVCEAFQAVKTSEARRTLLLKLREAEILAEMKEREERDAQAAATTAARQNEERKISAPRRRTAPTRSVFAAAGATIGASAVPHSSAAAFQPFGGARFRPSAAAATPKKSPPLSTPSFPLRSGASPSTSAASISARASARASLSSASASAASSSPLFGTDASDVDAFRAELTRWKMLFQADMAAEHARASQALVDRLGNQSGTNNALEAQLGRAIFTQAALPPPLQPNRSSVVVAVSSASSSPATTATSSSSVVSSASSTGVSSRLQQMRDRQRGVQTVAPSALQAPAAVSSSASRPLDPSHAALLTRGARFRLRTVAATPTGRPGAPSASAASSSSSSSSAPVAISLWLDSSHSMLQYRLVSSTHVHPDGVIPVAQLSSFRRLSKPSTCWFSIVQHDGKSMSVEASSAEVREQWIAALEALVKSST